LVDPVVSATRAIISALFTDNPFWLVQIMKPQKGMTQNNRICFYPFFFFFFRILTV